MLELVVNLRRFHQYTIFSQVRGWVNLVQKNRFDSYPDLSKHVETVELMSRVDE